MLPSLFLSLVYALPGNSIKRLTAMRAIYLTDEHLYIRALITTDKQCAAASLDGPFLIVAVGRIVVARTTDQAARNRRETNDARGQSKKKENGSGADTERSVGRGRKETAHMDVMTQSWQQPQRSGFLHFLIEKQTYLNIAYLLLALPLGTAYFVFLVTGFSLGVGLIVTLIGIPILLGMLAATWGLAAFERHLANQLLDARIVPLPLIPGQGARLWPRIRALVGSSTTWRSLAYLFLDFPLGILSFTLATTLLAIPPYLTFLPLYYRWTDFYYAPYHRVDTLAQAWLFVPVGIMLMPVAVAAVNGIAAGYRVIARTLLGSGADAGPYIPTERGKQSLLIWGCALVGVGLALTIGLWQIGSRNAVAHTFDAPFAIGPWLGGGFIAFFIGAALLVAASSRWSIRQKWGLGVAGFGLGLSLTLWPIGYIKGVERTFAAPLHLGPWMAAGFIPLFLGLALIVADLPARRA